ncbi:MAG: hypothetical protein RRY99_17680, partial [Flavobacterium sp.]
DEWHCHARAKPFVSRQLDRYYQVPNILQKQYITDLAEYIPHASNNATDVSAYHIVGNISYPELRLI